MKKNILTGTSSYYNRQWKGIFYPEDLASAKWFEYYAAHFGTFEINATFYKFPGPKTFHTWYNRTPANFTFAVKAPKMITHINKFSNSAVLIKDFYTACAEGLREKLGSILFQLPPSFQYSEENLALITAHLDASYNNVIEFRNSSWWTERVYEELKDRQITFCNVNFPGLPQQPVLTGKVVYFRFHGNPRLFYSEYSEEELQRIYNWLCTTENWERAYIFFNNTASEGGIKNATQFHSMIKSGKFYNLSSEPKEPPDS